MCHLHFSMRIERDLMRARMRSHKHKYHCPVHWVGAVHSNCTISFLQASSHVLARCRCQPSHSNEPATVHMNFRSCWVVLSRFMLYCVVSIVDVYWLFFALHQPRTHQHKQNPLLRQADKDRMSKLASGSALHSPQCTKKPSTRLTTYKTHETHKIHLGLINTSHFGLNYTKSSLTLSLVRQNWSRENEDTSSTYFIQHYGSLSSTQQAPLTIDKSNIMIKYYHHDYCNSLFFFMIIMINITYVIC